MSSVQPTDKSHQASQQSTGGTKTAAAIKKTLELMGIQSVIMPQLTEEQDASLQTMMKGGAGTWIQLGSLGANAAGYSSLPDGSFPEREERQIKTKDVGVLIVPRPPPHAPMVCLTESYSLDSSLGAHDTAGGSPEQSVGELLLEALESTDINKETEPEEQDPSLNGPSTEEVRMLAELNLNYANIPMGYKRRIEDNQNWIRKTSTSSESNPNSQGY